MQEKVLRPYHFHGIVLWIVCARVFLALIKMKLSCLQINLLHWHSHSSFCLFDTNMKDTAEILVSQFGNFAFCLEMLFLRTIKYFGHFVLGINIHVIRLLLFPGANFEKDKTDAVIRVYHDKGSQSDQKVVFEVSRQAVKMQRQNGHIVRVFISLLSDNVMSAVLQEMFVLVSLIW